MRKYDSILRALNEQIAAGKYAHGSRMPSENELAQRFGVSRPTAARAVGELVRAGMIERRVGSGTFRAARADAPRARTFGLLVPGLGNTEILDPICNEITRLCQARQCGMLWGDAQAGATAGAEEAHRLYRLYIERGVDGVFFAPIEAGQNREQVNIGIVKALDAANIPVVLLDRDTPEFPKRSRVDLVGIDNFHAGYVLAAHLVAVGHRTFGFLARPSHPSTTDARIAGCREAILRLLRKPAALSCWSGDPTDVRFLRKMLAHPKPDAIICSNDLTAALFMQTATASLALSIPQDIAVAGFDDVKYSTLLSVPLTTMRQPCRAIAESALDAMFTRIANPKASPRQTLLEAELVIRRSCGSTTRPV